MDERKRKTWPWIVATLVAIPVLYIVSFGPACWAVTNGVVSWQVAATVYSPLVSLAGGEPATMRDAPAMKSLVLYAELCNGKNGAAKIVTNSDIDTGNGMGMF